MDASCPIAEIELPGVPDVKLSGLIVVVGPNSAGKTQLLHDLNETVCGRRRDFVVVASMTLAPQSISFKNYFDVLVAEGAVRQMQAEQYQKRSLQYGTDEGAGSFHRNVMENQYNQFMNGPKKYVARVPESAFLKELGGLTCSALFLKNRLTLMDPCPTFNHTVEAPSKTLQALYLNRTAKEALCAEMCRVFQRAVWVDSTRIKQFVFRAADTTILPSPEDRLEPEAMEKYRTIESEGDGLRSYSAICATLLLEERPLCLLDEPEMCLHPPQAHAMGRFIGTHAAAKTCTIVATHSSHVLRGILETNPRAHVVRLSKNGKSFRARNLTPELLEQATSKPRSRSEAILEGLLANGVVLCEAEGDRLVYESTYRTLSEKPLDLRFTASEGTGGFADPLRLYRALGVPSAVITDIDFLGKDAELKKVLVELGMPNEQTQSICARAREALRRIRALAVSIDPLEIQSELLGMAQNPIDLSRNEDGQLRGRLHQLAEKLYRLKQLKERGLDAVPTKCVENSIEVQLRSDVEAVIGELQTWGLFLVPVGELESWLPILMRGQSREDKSRWAVLAAEKIEDVGERDDDVWLFVRSVRDFLQGAKPT